MSKLVNGLARPIEDKEPIVEPFEPVPEPTEDECEGEVPVFSASPEFRAPES